MTVHRANNECYYLNERRHCDWRYHGEEEVTSGQGGSNVRYLLFTLDMRGKIPPELAMFYCITTAKSYFLKYNI